MRALTIATLLAGLTVLPQTTATAGNWPSWRGPHYNGVADESGIPAEFGPEKNVAWKVPLPGQAGASPVVWGDRIFLTSVDGDDLVLLCFGSDGKQQWRAVLDTGDRKVRGDEGNMASPSPVTDGKHVWAMMGTGELACYTVDGEKVWQFDLEDRYGQFKIAFGMSSSPVLHDGRLLLQLIHGEGKAETQEAIVVGLDAASGDEIWKTERVTKATNENEHAYSSPVMYDFDGLQLFVTHGADFTIAYDPKSGKEIWRLGGLNPHDDPDRKYHTTLRFVSSPGIGPGIVVSPTAKRGPTFAIRPDLAGDLTGQDEALLWMQDRNTPDVPTPLVHEGLVYSCGEKGVLDCFDAKTGEQYYSERMHPQRYRASPVLVDGKIICTARDGVITVVKPGKEFEFLAENKLGESIAATPAPSDGTLYLRTFDHLWAIRAE